MAEFAQGSRVMTVKTPLADDVLRLTGFDGTEQLSGLYVFRLDLITKNTTKIEFDQILGKELTITMALSDSGGGETQRYFSGICRRLQQGSRGEAATSYQAEIVPQLWLKTRIARSRIFQQISVPDILKKVLGEVTGMKVDFQLDGNFEKREYCVQYRETDFNFVSRLMEEEGIFYFFKHTKAGHEMVVGNAPRVHVDVSGVSKVRFAVSEGEERRAQHVTDWVKVQEVRSGKFTLWDQSFQLPGNNFESLKNTLDSVAVGTVTQKLGVAGNKDFEIYDYPGEFAQRFDGISKGGGEQPPEIQKITPDGKRTVELRMQAEALAGLLIQGVSNCNQFSAGHKFSLERHFDADGNYVLVSVHHSAHGGHAYRTGEGDEFSYSNSFSCIPVALPFRPQRSTPKPCVMGVQTAVVVGPSGEEIFTDKYGRVKVQFPWDREGKHDPNSSCWLRVGTPWAGKQWGSIHIPRVGHEVIVQFLEGDPDAPIIVGSVYNAGAMPPYKLPDEKTKSTLQSRSSKGGGKDNFNEIRFEDKKGEEQVFINAEKDMDVRVENDSREFVKKDRHLIVKANQIELVEGDKHGHVKGKQLAKIDGDLSLTVGGKRQEKIGSVDTVEAGQEIHLKAGMKVIIEAGMQISLVGPGGFIDIGPSGVTIQGTMVLINSGGAAGSGTASSPEAPKDPDVADDGSKTGKLN